MDTIIYPFLEHKALSWSLSWLSESYRAQSSKRFFLPLYVHKCNPKYIHFLSFWQKYSFAFESEFFTTIVKSPEILNIRQLSTMLPAYADVPWVERGDNRKHVFPFTVGYLLIEVLLCSNNYLQYYVNIQFMPNLQSFKDRFYKN